MARPRRDQPLRAAPRFTPVGTAVAVEADRPPAPATVPRSRWRSVLVGLGVGAAVLVAAAGLAFSIVAIPLFFVASTEPGSGAHRDLVEKGLFFVALPFGGITGVLGGLVAGIWYGRGGRLPDPRR
jgi:hypothetical protein